jgi:hypothetical protein
LEFIMAIEPNPNHLKELLVLLCDRRLSSEEAAPMVDRALLALDDPAAYINDYPDDEWLVEGYDLEASHSGAVRLLQWIVFDELQPWLTCGEKPDDVVERVIDRLIEDGIAVRDPPQMDTLESYRRYLNEELGTVDSEHGPKELVEFDTGLIDDIGFFIVRKSDVPRILELAQSYRLRLNTTA